jgi:hypothetical protein
MISLINFSYFTLHIPAMHAVALVYFALTKAEQLLCFTYFTPSCVSPNVDNMNTCVNELSDYSLNSSDETNNLINC